MGSTVSRSVRIILETKMNGRSIWWLRGITEVCPLINHITRDRDRDRDRGQRWGHMPSQDFLALNYCSIRFAFFWSECPRTTCFSPHVLVVGDYTDTYIHKSIIYHRIHQAVVACFTANCTSGDLGTRIGMIVVGSWPKVIHLTKAKRK